MIKKIFFLLLAPLRLWQCRKCDDNFAAIVDQTKKVEVVENYLNGKCSSQGMVGKLDPQSCSIVCTDEESGSAHRVLAPNGSPCRRDASKDFEDDIAYCVHGGCFPVYRWNPEALESLETCQRLLEDNRNKTEAKRIFRTSDPLPTM